jgi:hypothetical protein
MFLRSCSRFPPSSAPRIVFPVTFPPGCAGRHEYIYLEPDQLGRVFVQPLLPPFRQPMLNGDVSALRVAEVAECLPEWLPAGGVTEKAYP